MIDWQQILIESLENGSVDSLVDAFQSQATDHAGTAPAKIKREAIKVLRRTKSDKVFPLILRLCHHENPTAQEVGAICITDYYPTHLTDVNRVLYRLADSPNWEVREWVASACGLILEKHFRDYLRVMADWACDPSENVRRAVVLATMYAGKSRNPEFIEPFLDVIEPLLADGSRYVRDNLGPFALGALIDYYPMQVLKRLDKWISIEDEQIRWNITMVFSSARGGKYAHQAKHILDILQADSRPSVRQAVAKAMKNVDKIASRKVASN